MAAASHQLQAESYSRTWSDDENFIRRTTQVSRCAHDMYYDLIICDVTNNV